MNNETQLHFKFKDKEIIEEKFKNMRETKDWYIDDNFNIKEKCPKYDYAAGIFTMLGAVFTVWGLNEGDVIKWYYSIFVVPFISFIIARIAGGDDDIYHWRIKEKEDHITLLIDVVVADGRVYDKDEVEELKKLFTEK